MHLPHGSVFEGDSGDQYILATVGFNELRPQVVAFSEDTIFHRDTLLCHLKERFAVFILIRLSCSPAAIDTPLPGPPVFAIGVAVNRPAAGDRDVLLLKGIDEV